MGLACVSCCWSALLTAGRAEAGEAIVAMPAKAIAATQIIPLNVLEAGPR
jgi:hypothetical protein